MKKTLTISLDDESFILEDLTKSDSKLEISRKNLVLNGEHLYNFLFCDINLKERIDVDIRVSDGMTDYGSAEKNIVNRIEQFINELINKINSEIVDSH